MTEFIKTNVNYAASVVELKTFQPINGADRIKVALIYGNSVIVSVDAKEGDIGLFFPLECQLHPNFLSNNNLYRKVELGNVDATKTGFFDQSGRIRALKMRGVKSEGFFIPLNSLDYTGANLDDFTVGVDFNSIDIGDGPVEICRKYIPKRNPSSTKDRSGKQTRKAKVDDLIVAEQFRLHTDTANMRRNAHMIKFDTMLSITAKLHGSSGVFANVLTKIELPWYMKLLQKIGIPVKDTQYGFVYSSRKVIKGVGEKAKEDAVHFYKEDLWGHVAAKYVRDKLPAGYSIYGEIVGYTPSGSPVQSCKLGPYSYGCAPNDCALYVYRVTNTNADGVVLELNRDQRIAFCERYGFTPVPELFYGRAFDLVSAQLGQIDGEYGESFVKFCESQWVNDRDCIYCKNGVPEEGIVITIDRMDRVENYKLKNFRFLGIETEELDAGKVDLETEESISAE